MAMDRPGTPMIRDPIMASPNAIEVRDLSKTFRIPTERMITLRERVVRRRETS